MFLADFGPAVTDLKSELAEQNFQEVGQMAHNLKGSCLFVGAVRLSGLCHRMNELARLGDLSGLRGTLSEAEAAFATVKGDLEEVLARCPPSGKAPAI